MRKALQVPSARTVAGAIEGFLMPVCLIIHEGNRFAATWPMGDPGTGNRLFWKMPVEK